MLDVVADPLVYVNPVPNIRAYPEPGAVPSPIVKLTDALCVNVPVYPFVSIERHTAFAVIVQFADPISNTTSSASVGTAPSTHFEESFQFPTVPPKVRVAI